MSRTIRLAVLAGACAVAAAALPATANAAFQRCPNFQVVVDDPAAGFRAGTYTRINHAPTNTQLRTILTCDISYQVVRSYLYRPYTRGTGWRVQNLGGGRQGKRFIKTGTNATVYFDFYRQGSPNPPQTITRTFNLSNDTTRRFTLQAPRGSSFAGGDWQVTTPGGTFTGDSDADAAELFEDTGIALWVPIESGSQYQVLVNTPQFAQPGQYTLRLRGYTTSNNG
jgi:hypothetical protein